MPLVQDYQIYCDETYTKGHVAFALGALICTRRRSELLHHEIDAVRKNFQGGYTGEIKWTKATGSKLSLYKALIDIFLDDPYARFAVMRVTKGRHWNEWGKSEEERFFKTYYHFLMRIVGPSSRYSVYPDEMRPQKSWRWDTLHFLVNRSRRDNWKLKRRNIRELSPVDSASDDLMQLTDLLLGGLVSTANAPVKMEIREKLADSLDTCTDRGNAKFRIWDWSPRPKQ